MMFKVLIVEDELSIAQMYQFKLEQGHHSVRVAYDGVTGFELARTFEPDIILLDIRMPGMSGDEVLKKIRETEWGSSIRVIILTNISRDEAPSSLRFLGVDRYIVKAHHTPSQIAAIVNEVLS